MPQKYEREIEDILRRSERSSMRRVTFCRVCVLFWEWVANKLRRLRMPVLPSRLLPSHLLLAGVALAVLSYLLAGTASGLALWLVLACLVLILGSIVLSVVRGRRRGYRPKWRGRVITRDDREEP